MNEFWIQTYTGQQFFFDDPANFSIIDIARSLANKARFGGHAQMPISVAEHSCVVCDTIRLEGGSEYQQLIGLIHDAHEAYTGDMTRPLKAYLRDRYGVSIKGLEEEIQQAIYKEFQIPAPEPVDTHLIATVDSWALAVEHKLFMRGVHPWKVDELKWPEHMEGAYASWEADEAQHAFENLFRRLHASVLIEERLHGRPSERLAGSGESKLREETEIPPQA